MHEQWHEKLLDGTAVLIRPLGPADAERERDFIEGLSAESRYFRFLDALKSPSPELIKQLTHVDRQRDVALVALLDSGAAAPQIGVARYCLNPDDINAECAVVVADRYQHTGLGTLLMRHLIEEARARGIQRLYSWDAVDNVTTRDFVKHLGFERKIDKDDTTLVIHSLDLRVADRPKSA